MNQGTSTNGEWIAVPNQSPTDQLTEVERLKLAATAPDEIPDWFQIESQYENSKAPIGEPPSGVAKRIFNEWERAGGDWSMEHLIEFYTDPKNRDKGIIEVNSTDRDWLFKAEDLVTQKWRHNSNLSKWRKIERYFAWRLYWADMLITATNLDYEHTYQSFLTDQLKAPVAGLVERDGAYLPKIYQSDERFNAKKALNDLKVMLDEYERIVSKIPGLDGADYFGFESWLDDTLALLHNLNSLLFTQLVSTDKQDELPGPIQVLVSAYYGKIVKLLHQRIPEPIKSRIKEVDDEKASK